jgi:transposase-like protein
MHADGHVVAERRKTSPMVVVILRGESESEVVLIYSVRYTYGHKSNFVKHASNAHSSHSRVLMTYESINKVQFTVYRIVCSAHEDAIHSRVSYP